MSAQIKLGYFTVSAEANPFAIVPEGPPGARQTDAAVHCLLYTAADDTVCTEWFKEPHSRGK